MAKVAKKLYVSFVFCFFVMQLMWSTWWEADMFTFLIAAPIFQKYSQYVSIRFQMRHCRGGGILFACCCCEFRPHGILTACFSSIWLLALTVFWVKFSFWGYRSKFSLRGIPVTCFSWIPLLAVIIFRVNLFFWGCCCKFRPCGILFVFLWNKYAKTSLCWRPCGILITSFTSTFLLALTMFWVNIFFSGVNPWPGLEKYCKILLKF